MLVTAKALGLRTEGSGSYTTGAARSATGLALSLRGTPQSITVMTRQQMDDFGLQTVEDVLESTPGIHMNKIETDRANPTARGFTIDYLQMDGTPLEASGSIEGDFLGDTAIYDRVEVVRGAAGLLTGAGNPSAAINLIRKRPTTDFQAYAQATAGRWLDGRLEGEVSGPLNATGSLRGRMVAAYQKNDSYIDFYEREKWVAYGIAEYDLTENTVLTVGVDYQKEDIDGTSYGEPVPWFHADGSETDLPRSTTTGAPWTFRHKDRTLAFAELEHAFGNEWRLKMVVNRLDGEYDNNLVYVSGTLDRETGEGLSASHNPFSVDREVTSIDVLANGPFELFGREHELIIGWNMADERNSRIGYERQAVEFESFYDWPAADPGYVKNYRQDWGWNGDQSGMYLASRWSVAEPLTLILGARHSTWDYDDWSNGVPGEGYEHDNVTTPYAGLIYDVTQSLSVYLSHTEVFNPQSARDRFGTFLDPVEGRNQEIGLKGAYFDGGLNLSLAVFKVEQLNVAEPDIMVDGEQRYHAADGITVEGYEAQISGQLAPGWNISAGYTYRDAEYDDGSQASTYAPDDMFRLSTSYRLPGAWKALTVGASAHWQSEMYVTDAGPNGETASQASYWIASLMGRYAFSDDISITVNVDNLFDERYFSIVPYYAYGYFGEPRNVRATLRMAF